jgi:hypothetical protein
MLVQVVEQAAVVQVEGEGEGEEATRFVELAVPRRHPVPTARGPVGPLVATWLLQYAHVTLRPLCQCSQGSPGLAWGPSDQSQRECGCALCQPLLRARREDPLPVAV